METIRLIGRNSRLSLLQLEIVKARIEQAFPELKVELIARSSRGDQLPDIPLQTVEGQDFFTRDIFEALTNGEADIAVHSLKDMSSAHFFSDQLFAVVDRDDPRDLAIFNPGILDKISRGETIIIGTCSPRREEMATVFLKNALPQLKETIHIETRPIRGNVETRLRKLDSGEYDATILATAGLNRLLRSAKDAALITALLSDKKIMLLPLIECVPAPCQGAIVAEAHPSNHRAADVLKAINIPALLQEAIAEKRTAMQYGTGCLQQFGVTSIKTKLGTSLYASGKNEQGTAFTSWQPWPALSIAPAHIFSTTDRMRDFFNYEWRAALPEINPPVVFIANYKLMAGVINKESLLNKTILVSGTKTWFELARQGYWVTAGADALGFEYLLPSLSMPLFNIKAKDILILTHEAAAQRWQKKGYSAACTYKLIPVFNPSLFEEIAGAQAICWSSYAQFEAYGHLAKTGVTHICAGGETASQLKQAGIDPVIFPTIKAFEQWRKLNTPSPNAA
jgi:hydroxymethylbilane synthase